MAEGTTAMGRTRMHDMMLLGYSVDDDVRTTNRPPTRQLRRHALRSA
jgi:hypothetical protein